MAKSRSPSGSASMIENTLLVGCWLPENCERFAVSVADARQRIRPAERGGVELARLVVRAQRQRVQPVPLEDPRGCRDLARAERADLPGLGGDVHVILGLLLRRGADGPVPLVALEEHLAELAGAVAGCSAAPPTPTRPSTGIVTWTTPPRLPRSSMASACPSSVSQSVTP